MLLLIGSWHSPNWCPKAPLLKILDLLLGSCFYCFLVAWLVLCWYPPCEVYLLPKSETNLLSWVFLHVIEWYFKINTLHTGIKSFSFLCGTQHILGQKVSTKSWMAAISLSPLREHWYYSVLSSNIRVKGDKIKRENKPIRLPLETWCSLSVPQCTASNRGNWNSWCLYWKVTTLLRL